MELRQSELVIYTAFRDKLIKARSLDGYGHADKQTGQRATYSL